jgi:hypothetical protein
MKQPEPWETRSFVRLDYLIGTATDVAFQMHLEAAAASTHGCHTLLRSSNHATCTLNRKIVPLAAHWRQNVEAYALIYTTQIF